MEFGLFLEVEVPRPWTSRSEYDTFHQVVEQVVLADDLGFDSVWETEHHFFPEYAHASSPETLLSFLAARTKKIRIGHGVRLLPMPYNHPVRSAEMAATLDILSQGRLEFGTGRSISWDEQSAFGVNAVETRAMSEEALEIILGCWCNEVFSYSGKYIELPPRIVVPKPVQTPHPPLWMAASGAESHGLVGEKGMGLLSFTLMVPPEELTRRIALYREGIANAKPVGRAINNKAATFTLIHVADSNAEARDTAAAAFEWYVKKSIEIVGSIPRKTPVLNPPDGLPAEGFEVPESYEYLEQLGKLSLSDITFDYLDANSLVIAGDPEYVAEKVALYSATGIDALLGMMQVHTIPHEKVMRSLRLFAEKVIPRFK